ncbi:MAG: Adenylate kinase [candidate division WS6 bacterium GW2011_GWA2_37_6]|uniref:Adenylate kinase n=1 Tax=candidate division WS6 bacterium GW2011_GWA2_37_6 TaxID=1619087 RepID=A0A0G0JDG7_9BACT|nr:MAG: Adenylate kinase [candidate division WS6 bacterium GW2011_GWA2_37_6]
MIYVVFGVPGVGKTAVVDKVIEQTGIKHVIWGDLTEEYMVKNKMIEDRDEMRKLDIRQQRPIQIEVAEEIVKMSKGSEGQNTDTDILIETHAAIKTPQGYWPGMNFDVFTKIKPDIFIVIEAAAKNILSRRQKDETRERKDDLNLQAVEDHLQITRDMASTFAVLTGGTVFYVENKEGDVGYAVGKIVEMMGK